MRVHEETLAHVRALIARLQAVPNGFYVSRLAGIHPEDIRTEEDFLSLPLPIKTICAPPILWGWPPFPRGKSCAYMLPAGTTGAPVVIPYTKKDIADWADMMARSLAIAASARTTACRSPRVLACGRQVPAFKRASNAWAQWPSPPGRETPSGNCAF